MKPELSRLVSQAKILFVLPAILFVTSVSARAATAANENWPQWRGPMANGVAPDANPPTSWSESSNIKWKVKLPGSGSATPVVWGGKVFVETAVPTGKKPAASTKSAEPDDAPSGGGRGMGGEKPDEVYQFMLICLDRFTGKTLWQKTAREE
ncbi:MAG TPA: hypothetical protein VFB72_11805, partial [Verrucomicrobiae bacterium]|nr:hypothetical protein [Verrucomicrobiae bacterium]